VIGKNSNLTGDGNNRLKTIKHFGALLLVIKHKTMKRCCKRFVKTNY
jgi:hypothetical protein